MIALWSFEWQCVLERGDKVGLSEHAGPRHIAGQLFSFQGANGDQFLPLPAVHEPTEGEQWHQHNNLQGTKLLVQLDGLQTIAIVVQQADVFCSGVKMLLLLALYATDMTQRTDAAKCPV